VHIQRTHGRDLLVNEGCSKDKQGTVDSHYSQGYSPREELSAKNKIREYNQPWGLVACRSREELSVKDKVGEYIQPTCA
jgi:hypothetical protein